MTTKSRFTPFDEPGKAPSPFEVQGTYPLSSQEEKLKQLLEALVVESDSSRLEQLLPYLRQMLSFQQIPAGVVEVIRQNIHVVGVLLLQLQSSSSSLYVQREASWILVNLCCFPVDVVQELNDRFGLLAILVQLVARCNDTQKKHFYQLQEMDAEMYQQMKIIEKIRENAVWALANVFTDIPQLRFIALRDFNIVNYINDSLTCLPEIQLDFLDLVLWLLRVLALDFGTTSQETKLNISEAHFVSFFEPIISSLIFLIESSQELQEQTQVNALLFLLSLCEISESAIEMVTAETPLAAVLVGFVRKPPSQDFLQVVLRLIGTVLSHPTEDYVQTFVANELLEALEEAWSSVGSQAKDIDKEICWILSNITVSNANDTILFLLNSDFFLGKLSECASSNSLGVIRESCYVIIHILTLGSWEVVECAIMEKHIFDLIVPLLALENQNPKIVALLLEAINQVFAREKALNQLKYYMEFQNKGGLEILEMLQRNQNYLVYKMASNILQEHCQAQEAQGGFEVETSGGNTFSI